MNQNTNIFAKHFFERISKYELNLERGIAMLQLDKHILCLASVTSQEFVNMLIAYCFLLLRYYQDAFLLEEPSKC